MPTNPSQRGSAMVELMMLIIGAAVLMAVVNKLFLHPFSESEAQWTQSALQVHRHVGHQVCLENVSDLATVKPVHFKKGIPICSVP